MEADKKKNSIDTWKERTWIYRGKICEGIVSTIERYSNFLYIVNTTVGCISSVPLVIWFYFIHFNNISQVDKIKFIQENKLFETHKEYASTDNHNLKKIGRRSRLWGQYIRRKIKKQILILFFILFIQTAKVHNVKL